MDNNFLILTKGQTLDPYYKDIENIYTSNGWGTSYPASILKKMYGNCYYLLATNGKSAVGLVRAFTDDVTVTHLSEIVIDKTFHGKGVGSSLMTTFLSDLGHTTIYAEVLDTQAPILFKKFGFQQKTKLTVYARRASTGR
jgi:ribosomal protein S18 acetylase RimI-like enzyme